MKQLLFILLSLQYVSIYSQQIFNSTSIEENFQSDNPAMVGTSFFLSELTKEVNLGHRNQWSGISNHPTSSTLSIKWLNKTENNSHLILGGKIASEGIGPLEFKNINGNIGVLLANDPYYGGVSLGLSFGVSQLNINTDKIIFREQEGVERIEFNDPIVTQVGVGVNYFKHFERGFFNGDYLVFGAFIPNVSQKTYEIIPEKQLGISNHRHYYFSSIWYHQLDHERIVIPFFNMQYVAEVPIEIVAGLKYHFNAWFLAGASYSYNKNMEWQLGVKVLENIRLGYAYEIPLTNIHAVNGSTHQILVSVAW